LFTLTLLTALLVAGGVSTYLSPLFRVQTLEVIATPEFDAALLAEIAGLRDESMFTAPLTLAESRLEAIPEVKDAKVQRRWPHTVRIVVEPRVPWGYWQVGDVNYVVDLDGVIISRGASIGAAPAIIQTDSEANLRPGVQVDADAVMVADSLLETVPREFGLNIIYFQYSRAEGLSLVTDSGYSAVIGDSYDLDYKLAVWQSVEEKMGRQRLQGQVLDLRFGDRPSLRRQ
jgi:cell division septal protein FtsQ